MEENTNVVIECEKISQKKKKLVVWILTASLFVATLVSFFVDYSSYKKGQQFGLASATVISELSGSSWVNENDSYADQCKSIYKRLNRDTPDRTINGIKYDASAVRESESALRVSFAKVMEGGGYDRYRSNHIMDWFKYTNPIEYYSGYYATKLLPVCFYAYILFSIIFTLLINHGEKKELVVYEDSVLCKLNPKKSKQIVFEDISNIDFGKNSLKISGTGVKFKISKITNAEEIKTVLIDKKNASQSKIHHAAMATNTNNADELRKYKELLDAGVISQEEFEAKKKQLLGL